MRCDFSVRAALTSPGGQKVVAAVLAFVGAIYAAEAAQNFGRPKEGQTA